MVPLQNKQNSWRLIGDILVKRSTECSFGRNSSVRFCVTVLADFSWLLCV